MDETTTLVDRSKKYVNMYANSTGLECKLIDIDGNTLFEYNPDDSMCSLCSNMNPECCRESHVFGAHQAKILGGSYIFFCPIGLIHFISPIILKNKMVGALLSGHLLMVAPDDLLYSELVYKLNTRDSDILKLKKDIDKIPVYSPTRVKSLAELLYNLSLFVSDQTASYLYEIKKKNTYNQNIVNHILDLKTINKEPIKIKNYPIEKEKELMSLVALGDKEGSSKLLTEILAEIQFLYGNNINTLKSRILELTVLLSRAALEGGADPQEILGYNYQYLNQINNHQTQEALNYWMEMIMMCFIDSSFNFSNAKHTNVIYKSIDYIRKNYMKNLTLEETATYVNLTPQYLGKIFKEDMTYCFNTYLNRVRIENSKNLLINTNYPITEISYLVGFSDQSHFSRTFKKILGITPGKYRNKRGI